MMLATMFLFHLPGSFSGQARLPVRTTFSLFSLSLSFSFAFSLSFDMPIAAETDFQPLVFGLVPSGVVVGDGRMAGGVPPLGGGLGMGCSISRGC